MTASRISTVIQHLRRAVLPREGVGPTDGELLENFVSRRDEAALAALVRRHGLMVWGVCRRILRDYHDAEDASQATFLVLVRKAASVRPRELVANWLYGVAHQTALKARATRTRRAGRERQVATMPEPAAKDTDRWRDLQPWLDEELSRLPDMYRAVLVLCDLEGRTRKETARHLRVPEGTVAGRLARARTMLARRLARHGLSVSGAALAAVVSQRAAAAGVPSPVLSSTIRAARAFAAGQTVVSGGISVRVATLTEGVLKAMLRRKLKAPTLGLLLAALLSGAAGAIYQTPAAGPPKGEEKNKTMTGVSTSQVAPPPAAAEQGEYVIVSRVLEAGADQPREVLGFPKVTVEDGQQVPIHIIDGPENLLAKVVEDEKIKIGTFLDVRVKRLSDGKVRLFLSFQKHALEKAGASEIQFIGNSVQTIQDVELHKPAKIAFQKDAKGSPQGWVEITVAQQKIPAPAIPPTK
jgi:RNA polymerase sigma factor (sigma-70 family)